MRTKTVLFLLSQYVYFFFLSYYISNLSITVQAPLPSTDPTMVLALRNGDSLYSPVSQFFEAIICPVVSLLLCI